MTQSSRQTRTSSFGVGRREGHDASAFYDRFSPPVLSDDETVDRPPALLAELGPGRAYVGSIDEVELLPANSVALVVTSPPYFVGKDYELAATGGSGNGDGSRVGRVPATYLDYLDMLRTVFAECRRVLEPGGRIAVNVANLGRKPYRSLSADVTAILQDDLGLLLRGEVIWEKAAGASGSCAWGSFAKASNPVLRDVTERVIVAGKGRFARALSAKQRQTRGLPHRSTLTNDEFVDVTRDVWRIDSESATRVGHPAPFPVELPRRLIELYTYEGDLVVDPFLGSGTTLVAAARTGRIGVGFDTDPDYVDLAGRRLAGELERIASVGKARADGGGSGLEGLGPEDRQEVFQALAVEEGRKLDDIAARVLTEAGFEIEPPGRPVGGVVDLTARVADRTGAARWAVEVVGSFVVNRPGLQRADLVWRLLGRLHVLAGAGSDPVLVLTAALPRPGSPADRTLRAAGPGVLFDAIELYDPAALERLARYAAGEAVEPLPGFWSAKDLKAKA